MLKKVHAAGLIISDAEKNLLLLQRVIQHPDGGKWCVPGGAVEAGETPLEAAVRETFEETGLRIDAVNVFHVGTYTWEKWEKDITFDLFAIGLANRPEAVECRPNEHTAYAWVSLSEALNRKDLALGLDNMLPDYITILSKR